MSGGQGAILIPTATTHSNTRFWKNRHDLPDVDTRASVAAGAGEALEPGGCIGRFGLESAARRDRPGDVVELAGLAGMLPSGRGGSPCLATEAPAVL